MKRSFIGFLSTFALLTGGMVWGNSSGPPDGHHGEVQNCTSCHNDSAQFRRWINPFVWITSNYIPGQTYDLTALVSGTHVRGYGFQLIAKAGSSPSGSLAAVSSGMAISNGYAEHTTRSTSGSWNFQWTAPSTNEGNVTFFASGLATGGLNNSSGDQVYTYSRTLLEPPSLEWNSSVGGVIFSSPAISSDGTVYVGSNDNKLHAFNSDGSTKWAFTTGNWVDSTPAIGSDGTVYVGSWDNKLYALDPTNGSKLWDFNTSSSITASPAIGSNGNLYFGSKDYFFYASIPAETNFGNTSPGNPSLRRRPFGKTARFTSVMKRYFSRSQSGWVRKRTYAAEDARTRTIHSLLPCPRSFRNYLF